MSEAALLEILDYSRAQNDKLDITGMLLYIQGNFINVSKNNLVRRLEGRFIQVLEGDETTVKALFDVIRSDERHHDVIILKEAETSNRNFEGWTMGFRSMEADEFKAAPGFFPLDDEFLKKPETQQSNIPLNCLRSFYQMSKGKL